MHCMVQLSIYHQIMLCGMLKNADQALLGSLNGLTSLKWWKWFNMAFSHHFSTRLNTYGRFRIDILDSALHPHHIREYLDVWSIHPAEFRDSMTRHIKAVLAELARHLTMTLVFSFNLSLVCIQYLYVSHTYTKVKTVKLSVFTLYRLPEW